MGVFDFLKSKDYSYLKLQGGMTNKYQQLINHLENLAKHSNEFHYSDTGDRVERRHEYKSQLTSTNEYTVEVLFKRERHIFINLDSFKLVDKNETLIVEYTRTSKYVSSLMPKIIPERVMGKFKFVSSLDQETIFKDLLRQINLLFKKYRYSDQTFKAIYEN